MKNTKIHQDRFAMQKNFFFFLFILLLQITTPVFSQSFGECGTGSFTEGIESGSKSGCDYNSGAWLTKYRTPGHWIPDNSTPVKTILVNWIICRDDNGNNGWENSQQFRDQVDEMFDSINMWYSNSLPKGYTLTCEPTYTHIYDTRIRFELNEIIFLDNTTFNQSNDGGLILAYIHQNYPSTKNSLNHIFTQPDNPYGGWGYYSSHPSPYVFTRSSMYAANYVVWDDHIHHIAHEYGHALGLHHTYDKEYTNMTHYDYLDDIFGLCPEPSCPCSPPPNNICYFTTACIFSDPPNPGPYPLMSGEPNSRFISPKYAGRMHRALSMYGYVFRLNNTQMHNFVKEKYPYSIPYSVNGDETWDFAIKMYQDIVIETGTTLTIKCEVLMPIDGKIIVEPGAKLIVDGGRITCAHDGFWQGIEVWGNKYQSQIPKDPQTGLRIHQGKVQVTNGGTIENAVNAIWAIRWDEYGNKDWSKTGGVIILDSANLINNNYDVWIGAYHNYFPTNGRNTRNYSSIRNSRFEKNDNMPEGYDGYAFIGLWDVGIISIKGNSFKNLKTNLSTEDRGRGIVAYSATINLTDYCPSAGSMYQSISQTQAYSAYPTPCVGAVRNHFEGLYYGVWASNVTGYANSIIHIDRASFEDVYHGIYINNAQHSSVTRCDFEIPPSHPSVGFGGNLTHAYGIYLDGSDGYRVEENNLTNGSDPQAIRGIVINESGFNNNEIYNNKLESSLGYAIQAQGDNRGGYQFGLGLYCNEMAENLSDIVVMGNGIKVHQKIIDANNLNEYSAGNIFTSCFNNNYQNYNNQSAATIYYYSDDNNVPQCITNVNIIPNLTRSCPSKLAYTLPIALQSHSTARLAYNSAVTMLHIWQDGGNANLEYEVETTLPWDVYVQFNELMGESPYLSDDVLLAAINNPAFSSLMIKLLMAANTHAVHNPEIMQAIYERDPPLPEAYIAEIESGFDQVSQLDLLRGDVAATRHLVDILTNDIKRHYQMEYEDGEDVKADYLSFVASINTLASRYNLAALYLQTGDYESMETTLNDIHVSFELDDIQQEDLDNWTIYFGIAADLKQSGIYPGALTQAQIDQLEAIAELENRAVAPAARALLMLNQHGYAYKEEVKPVPENSPRKGKLESGIDKTRILALKVYPNPCNNYITLEYRTGNKYNNLRVEITDVTGKTVLAQRLKGGDDDELLGLTELKPGVYFVRLIGDNAVVDTQKITIVR